MRYVRANATYESRANNADRMRDIRANATEAEVERDAQRKRDTRVKATPADKAKESSRKTARAPQMKKSCDVTLEPLYPKFSLSNCKRF